MPASDDPRSEKGRVLEPNFKAEEFTRLTPPERVKWCRQMALEAAALAEKASAGVRTAYVELSKQWTGLADEIERDSRQRK